ncbi:MAG: DUF2764 family protein [Bacteroidales bacterium]|nr:DUF2764 family protein [Bacteroidales bacterium]
MNKKNYHCLIAGLPDLIPDDKKRYFSSAELRDYLLDELRPADFELVKLYYLPFDHENLLNLLFVDEEFQWDERGNYSRKAFEQLADKKQLKNVNFSMFPPYFRRFVLLFHDEEVQFTRAGAMKFLTEDWYKFIFGSKNEFVKTFGEYKRNIVNIMLALNGRKHNIPFEDAIIGNDEIARMLKTNRSRDFGLTDDEFNDIENILQLYEIENLLERELKLDNYTWQFIDEITFFNYFTIERILGFVQKLFIAERWLELDKEKGQHIFKKLLEELESNFEFPEEFSITYGKRR